MATIRLPEGAEELLHYFESVDRDYPGEHWRNGAELCKRWLALLAGAPTQADVDAFVARLEAETNYGSGWLDLGMQFRHWLNSAGSGRNAHRLTSRSAGDRNG